MWPWDLGCVWRKTYYALAVFKSSDAVAWTKADAVFPVVKGAPLEIGTPIAS
jgi:hypothetical protein